MVKSEVASRNRRSVTFEAFNQAYAAQNAYAPTGAECNFETGVYPKDNLATGCAWCKPNAMQCPHGKFCFSFFDYVQHQELCRCEEADVFCM